MWSDRYYYLKIYADENLGASTCTRTLIDFIEAIPELESDGNYGYKNSGDFPFVSLSLIKARNINSWSSNDFDSSETNLINIVYKKGKNDKFETAKLIYIRIAKFLQWKLIDEETDDDIENFVIWTPSEN